jgi:DNA (cytosine-5)-methyltransferase 1
MLKTLDLFAGAGCLSYGFKQTGEFRIVAAAENNINARNTFLKNHNIENNIIMIDDVLGYDFIALNDKLNGIDIVIGGPPCQGFSNANRNKNTIISMNNALIKEYFRAIKEIRPKAFVMENVSMLQSEVHRFFDSSKDHDEVEKLGIEMRDDIISITAKDYDNLDILSLIKDNGLLKQSLIPEKLFSLLNVLCKKRSNSEHLNKYLEKCKTDILNQSNKYCVEVQKNDYTEVNCYCLGVINSGISSSYPIEKYICDLEKLVEYQKSIRYALEIYKYQIICDFVYKHGTRHVDAKVKSYSVIDYIKAILSDDYKQSESILNASWFGVPQERKRYLIMGIRSDLINGAVVELPQEPDKKPNVTVEDAIMDLVDCDVSTDINAPGILIHASTDGLISDYALSMRYNGLLYNHITTKTTEEAMKRFKALREGENFHKLPQELTQSYQKPERTQNTIYLRLDRKKPSGTVVNVRKSMWIHPVLDRAITVREAARLQSIPDEFVFIGPKDSQYQQVGNAVPPLLASAVAEKLLTYFR